ncbi:hypothetical protein [Acidovorax sp. FG27]|uniref:hypothetical protein n=1 Tax=Acidovorax sp. FG27 TaxID=3133652 RepID=UPI00333F58F3
MVTVLVGIPLLLACWIGGLMLASKLGTPISAAQMLAWVLSVFVAAIVWPLGIRRFRRDCPYPEGSGLTPQAPTRLDAAARVLVLFAGGIAIVLVCGPLGVVAMLGEWWQMASAGGRADGPLLQLAAILVSLLLAAPVLIASHRALRHLPPGDPRRLKWQERESWYYGAAVAWVVSLGIGMMASLMALRML